MTDYYKIQDNSWYKINKEYLEWKKTLDFKDWYDRQLLKQKNRCYYCGYLFRRSINVEHIVPKGRGNNNKKNLVLACGLCNKNKGTKMIGLNGAKRIHKEAVKRRWKYKMYIEYQEDLGHWLKTFC